MNRKPVQKSLTQKEAADLLGVTRTHLNLVLNGHRKSRRLTRRYQELLQSLETINAQ